MQGITTAKSEKQDKRVYNRRLRHLSKQIMNKYAEPEILPHVRECSDLWNMSKDGKMRFDPKQYPKGMRK